MTAPDSRGSSRARVPGSTENPFATAEKLMAQFEARHAATAAGRRVVGPGVSEYLTHERCTEACSRTGHRGHPEPRHRAREQHRPPPDTHPHFSDLLAWVLPVGHDEPGGSGRREGGRH